MTTRISQRKPEAWKEAFELQKELVVRERAEFFGDIPPILQHAFGILRLKQLYGGGDLSEIHADINRRILEFAGGSDIDE